MRLPNNCRYAVTAMLELVIHRELGPASLAHIPQRQGDSLAGLVKKNVVRRIVRIHNIKHGRACAPAGGPRLIDSRVPATGRRNQEN
ncbi:MAG TPA: hypothetical protein DEF79_04400 [Gammaproteobacteria bacterium]|nr:hypothetical protein [Gammaproteobacteria bacterium]|tara:strand:- start:5159 stop:5419 length:261 start_codon:yes stop_codon:yes gene_type:complete